MGFRARRSIKIAPGIRLNVSAKSVGVSAGVRGARVSVNSRGRRTTSVGIPGTGVSYVTSSSSRSNAPGTRPAQKAAVTTVPVIEKKVKPSLFAPASEKALYKLISKDTPDAAAIHAVGRQYPDAVPTASFVEVLEVAIPAGDQERMRTALWWLWEIAYDPATDPFIAKYYAGKSMVVPIAEGITVTLPVSRQALVLLAAELQQASGNLDQAIEAVEQLDPTTVAAVSLAELYADAGRWDDVVDLTNGLTNDDEAATFLLIQRGRAFREQGYAEASREALKEALRPRSRPAELRRLAWIERGRTYLGEGKKAMARKDFERVLAENAAYPGLQELLAATL